MGGRKASKPLSTHARAHLTTSWRNSLGVDAEACTWSVCWRRSWLVCVYVGVSVCGCVCWTWRGLVLRPFGFGFLVRSGDDLKNELSSSMGGPGKG